MKYSNIVHTRYQVQYQVLNNSLMKYCVYVCNVLPGTTILILYSSSIKILCVCQVHPNPLLVDFRSTRTKNYRYYCTTVV